MKIRKENGEVVVEASIVVTIVVIFITALLYIGMIMYQQTLISSIANQTASNIAQLYSNNQKDAFTGYIASDNVYQAVTYNSIKTDAYMDVIKQKANVYAKYRLKSSSILAADTTTVTVDIVEKQNELLKSQLVVTITGKYDVPLVGMFGTDGLVTFSASGRADCVDLLEYLNGVKAISDPENSNIVSMTDNCIVTFIADSTNPSDYATVTVLRGESISTSSRYTKSKMPSTPTNNGLEFVGWIDSITGHSFNAATTIASDTIVYGKWRCSVTLDATGGTVNSNSAYSFKVDYGTRTNLPNPVRTGYNFKGWYTEKNGMGTRYISNDTTIQTNLTLYAFWEKIVCSVTFDPQGGSLPAGVAHSVTVSYGSTVSMPEAKRQGYIFNGWYTSDGTRYTSSTPITGTVVLKAGWTQCVSHVYGDCGVNHRVNYSFSWHSTPYYGTTRVRCIVCKDCGCLLNGNTCQKINVVLKPRFNSSDSISTNLWCAEHYRSSARIGTTVDTHLGRNSAGSFYIH